MPKIIGQEEQLAAFNEIKAVLKEMEQINKFLKAEHPSGESGEFTITFKDENNHKLTINIFANKQEINKIVSDHRKSIAAGAAEKAEIYRIEFDREERLLLGLIEEDSFETE